MRLLPVLTFTIAALVGGVSISQAKVYAPETEWMVSSFGQAQTAADPFCAMARRYTGGTIITFAQNSTGESSVAFEQAALSLDQNTSYAVNLASGNDYLSSFDIKPVTSKAFVLKLGQDKPFFSAIQKNSYMAVRVNATDIELPLTGIDQGLAELSSCVNSLGGVAKVVPAPQAAPYEPVRTAETPKPSRPAPVATSAEEAVTQRGDIPDFIAYDAPKSAPAPLASEPVKKMQPILENDKSSAVSNTAPMAITAATAVAKPGLTAREARSQGVSLPKPTYGAEPVAAKAVETIEAKAPTAPAIDTRPTITTSTGPYVEDLREENIRLSRALEAERRQFENASLSSVDNNAVRELTDRLDMMSRENRILRGKLETQENGREYLDLASALARMQTNEKNMIVQIEEQKKALSAAQQEIASLKANRPAPQAVDMREIEALRAENNRLRQTVTDLAQNKPQAAEQATATYTNSLNALQSRLANLEAENTRLKTQLSEKPAVVNAPSTVATGNAAAEYELSRLKKRYTQSELENQRLGKMLREARAQQVAPRQAISDQVGVESVAVTVPTVPVEMLTEKETASDASTQASEIVTADAAPMGIRPPARFDKEPKQKRAQRMVEKQDDVSPVVERIEVAVIEEKPIIRATPIVEMSNRAVPSSDTQQQLLSLLRDAQINGYSSMTQLAGASKPGFAVYQWQDGRIYGTAEVTDAPSAQAFDTLMNAYIERTRQRCQGAFDAMSGEKQNAYDIACVDGPNGDAVASLYFLHKDGKFITIALETLADNFAQAMNTRDRIAKSNS